MADSQLVPSEIPELDGRTRSGTGVTVVVPTFGEAANLPELFRRIGLSLPDVEILVVDDDSPDGTA